MGLEEVVYKSHYLILLSLTSYPFPSSQCKPCNKISVMISPLSSVVGIFLIVKTVPSKILFVKNQTLNLNPFKLLLSKDNSSKQCISFFVAGFLYGFFVSIDKFL